MQARPNPTLILYKKKKNREADQKGRVCRLSKLHQTCYQDKNHLHKFVILSHAYINKGGIAKEKSIRAKFK